MSTSKENHNPSYKDIDLIKQALLTNNEAAVLVNCSSYTMRLSRSSGKLLTVKAPDYIRIGRSIRYKRETILAWLDQFNEQQNTAA